MVVMERLLGLAILMVFMASAASADSIGVAPGFQDFGEIQRGESRVANLYITTSGYENAFAVAPQTGDPLTSTFMDSQDSPVSVDEYTSEEIDSWIRFDQNTYTVTPGNTTPYTLADGTPVNAAGRVQFYIDVPQDAEPGYHAGMLNVNPQLGDSGTGFGASARGQSMYNFVFRVPGNVERSIDVVDARGIRTADDEARIDMRVANRGTVTTAIQGADVDVVNRQTQELIDELSLGYHELAPGESTVISSTVRSSNISQGTYQINGTLEYIGGSSFVNQQTFSLADSITTEPPGSDSFGDETQGTDQGSEGGPVWLLALFVALVAVLMYAFEFDMFSIVLIGGGLGIVGFILMTGIPNWTLLILLTSTAGILMYG